MVSCSCGVVRYQSDFARPGGEQSQEKYPTVSLRSKSETLAWLLLEARNPLNALSPDPRKITLTACTLKQNAAPSCEPRHTSLQSRDVMSTLWPHARLIQICRGTARATTCPRSPGSAPCV